MYLYKKCQLEREGKASGRKKDETEWRICVFNECKCNE